MQEPLLSRRGNASSKSWAYINKARAVCFVLLTQEIWRADARAWAKTGKRIAARRAMIAMTTSNSVSVKPRFIRKFSACAIGTIRRSIECLPADRTRRLPNRYGTAGIDFFDLQ